MLVYPIIHPVGIDNDLRSTMLGDNAYTVPLNRSEKGIAAYDKQLRVHAAQSDNWNNFELMVNPMDEPISSHLCVETAETFIKHLSRDRFLKQYLRSTSRQLLHSRPVDGPVLDVDAA